MGKKILKASSIVLGMSVLSPSLIYPKENAYNDRMIKEKSQGNIGMKNTNGSKKTNEGDKREWLEPQGGDT